MLLYIVQLCLNLLGSTLLSSASMSSSVNSILLKSV